MNADTISPHREDTHRPATNTEASHYPKATPKSGESEGARTRASGKKRLFQNLLLGDFAIVYNFFLPFGGEIW